VGYGGIETEIIGNGIEIEVKRGYVLAIILVSKFFPFVFFYFLTFFWKAPTSMERWSFQ
jgi:hypothetical protein